MTMMMIIIIIMILVQDGDHHMMMIIIIIIMILSLVFVIMMIMKTKLNKEGKKCLHWSNCDYLYDEDGDHGGDYHDHDHDHCLEHVGDPSARGRRGCKVVETVKFRPQSGLQFVNLSPDDGDGLGGDGDEDNDERVLF